MVFSQWRILDLDSIYKVLLRKKSHDVSQSDKRNIDGHAFLILSREDSSMVK
jgi:hypothetical protein